MWSRHHMWGRTLWLKVPSGREKKISKSRPAKFCSAEALCDKRPVDQSVQFAPGPIEIFRTCKDTSHIWAPHKRKNQGWSSLQHVLKLLHHLSPTAYNKPSACLAYLCRSHITGSDSTSAHCSSLESGKSWEKDHFTWHATYWVY